MATIVARPELRVRCSEQEEAAARRYSERQSFREDHLKAIREGDARAANDVERIALRLSYLESHGLIEQGSKGEIEGLLERIIGGRDLVSLTYLRRLEKVAQATGRVVIGGQQVQGYGTGFLISPELMMTNNHVLPTESLAATSQIEMGYEHDEAQRLRKSELFELDPAKFYYTNARLDFTIVAVRPISVGGKPLTDFGFVVLQARQGKLLNGEYVTIVQHPAGRPKEIALRANQVLDIFADFIHYSADTEAGASGAGVYNDQFELVALHHSGVPRKDSKGRVLALGGGLWKDHMGTEQIDWVANEGVRVSSILHDLSQQSFSSEERQVVSPLMNKQDNSKQDWSTQLRNSGTTQSFSNGPSSIVDDEGGHPSEISYELNLPITVRISVGRPIPPHPPSGESPSDERTRTRDVTRYMGRGGYDPGFLSHRIGMPGLGEHAHKVVELLDQRGQHELKYRNFSVIMQRQRRAPLVTAVNIDGARMVRLSRGDRNWHEAGDKWFFDPRIDRRFQLGDGEGIYESQLIDRGHMVRRLDPVWGDSNAARQANDDTFHYTNSVPQHKNLNQKIWLKLEDSILDFAREKKTRVSVFTGPILAAGDPTMRGYQIPLEFYKVAVAEHQGEIKVAGYIQSQREWSNDFEEQFDFDAATMKVYRVALSEISRRSGLDFSHLEQFELEAREVLTQESTSQGLFYSKYREGDPIF